MNIRDWPLPYADRLAPRVLADIDLVIVHCTELPDLTMARDYGERVLYEAGTGNSGHFYVDRDGSVSQWVPLDRIAHHCRGYNPRSLGIELVNTGRYPAWFDSRRQTMTEPYPEAQIDALRALLMQLKADLPGLRFIAGHEDFDTGEVPASDDAVVMIRRKRDPGRMFDWDAALRGVPLSRIS
jgi:N-acetylmuramoyl-L-alanine amidase